MSRTSPSSASVKRSRRVACGDAFGHEIEPAVFAVKDELTEAHIRRVVHDLAGEIVPEIIADQALVQIGPVEHPFMVGIHAHHGDVVVLALVVEEIQQIGQLLKGA